MNRALRDLIGETSITYVADTTINRSLNWAQWVTLVTLRENTAIATDTIVLAQSQMDYTITDLGDGDVMAGGIVAINRRTESSQGSGSVGWIEISPNQIGKLGEGVIPNSYTVVGDRLLFGTRPVGGDVLDVYYVPVADTLANDATELAIAVEDQPAMLFLAASLICARDKQLQQAQLYFQMFQAHVQAKRSRPTVGAVQ
jgi:hypothetical protein